MTAKEKLKEAVEELSEAEAAEALEILVQSREGQEPGERTAATLDELLEGAPLDDEPETDEERRAVAEARQELRRGEVVSAEEIRREIA